MDAFVLKKIHDMKGRKTLNICPLCCRENADVNKPNYDDFYVHCSFCGSFFITSTALVNLEQHLRNKLPSIIRERAVKGMSRLAIFSERPRLEENRVGSYYRVVTLEEVEDMFPKNISERIDRTLINLTSITAYPGSKIKIETSDKNLFFTESNDGMETLFLMEQLVNDGYVIGHVKIPTELKVTVKGWNSVSELQRKEEDSKGSKQAFIAMWFSSEMDAAAEQGIKKAISDCGYNPVRIDQKEHNNKIDDEIIAEIKQSNFVIADFTGQRGGVYFEAGYAMGLGKPVIWTVRSDDLTNVHFDTRQYAHIVWNDTEDLYQKLFNRIKATIATPSIGAHAEKESI
ncbi:nucleoside 2-deoxyribosyltransferase [Bacillus gobiensis]|uniref:nucleoside 2-deoxyribosyltransferase n=1 Tax=Bacillus gobiensis TaxID=1441095 RepID=UPI003D229B3D